MTSIDASEYVESENGTLKFGNEVQQAKFELGVCMAVYKWEELTTAVENSWGGPKSGEKRDWISCIIIDLFSESKIVDVQLIEETLLYAMLDEFDTQVDNDSALEIAALIMKFYKEAAKGAYDMIDQFYQVWLEKKKNTVLESTAVHVGEDLNNPGVSDSEEDDDDDNDERGDDNEKDDESMEVDDIAEVQDVQHGPVIDEDGFKLVQKGRRRR
ncbi:TSR2 [Candida oxycetoniae]|uniref:TSR2 n=1 Tax=Candida oxycetoniae TaxID=497107 RepID=A0AAI9SX86_9ASCO|nr:TSR2 [Candida oxycetoniae]KAI3404653.2 TSR2 [Candida oxycetoniae]